MDRILKSKIEDVVDSLRRESDGLDRPQAWLDAAILGDALADIYRIAESMIGDDARIQVDLNYILHALWTLPRPTASLADRLIDVCNIADDIVLKSRCIGLLHIMCRDATELLYSVIRHSSIIESWLRDDQPQIKCDGASLIGYCNLSESRLIELLTPLLNDSDDICGIALLVLANSIRSVSKDLFAILIKRADHPNPNSRAIVYMLLSLVDTSIINDALGFVSQGLHDDNISVRESAINSQLLLQSRLS